MGKWYSGEHYIVVRILYALFVAFVIALISGFFYLVYQRWSRVESKRPSIPEEVLPPREELERLVEETNGRLTRTKISGVGVGIEGVQPAARFTIEPDHPNFYFESMGYTIETGGNISQIPTAGICQIIERIEQEKDARVLDSLDRINFEAEFGKTGVTFKTNATLRAIFEVLFAIRAVTDVPKKKAQILLKGYADDQKLDWDEALKQERYRFRRIPVLLPVKEERDSYNPVNFEAQPTFVSVPDHYKNRDLPNLRAAFFKKDFIIPLLKECGATADVEVYILSGYALNKHDPKQRRVDVQINLF